MFFVILATASASWGQSPIDRGRELEPETREVAGFGINKSQERAGTQRYELLADTAHDNA